MNRTFLICALLVIAGGGILAQSAGESNAPPMLIMAADGEDPDRIAQNRELYKALKAAGHPNVEFRLLIDRTHNTIASNMLNENDEAYDAILAFFAKHGSRN